MVANCGFPVEILQISCIEICSVFLYLQLFVGGLMSSLHYLCCLCIMLCPTHIVLLFCQPSSCVPYYIASFSELSICYCPFGILQRLFAPKDFQHSYFWYFYYKGTWCRLFTFLYTCYSLLDYSHVLHFLQGLHFSSIFMHGIHSFLVCIY